MIVQFSAEADGDRFVIWDYLSDQAGIKVADDMDTLFVTSVLKAAEMPEQYKPERIVGTREIVVTPKYVIIYQFDLDVLLVLRVLHTARQWPE